MEEAHARRAAALRLNPQLAQACNRLGDLSARERRFDAAVQDYARAIWLKPDYAQAYHNRAMAYHALGKYGPAVSDFAKVVELTPEDPFAYNNVAWVLATCPEPKHRDGSKAVANATRAVELLGRDVPDVLGTLAAACAEAGDFKNAVRWQEKTLQLAPEREKDMQRQRLELYKAQKPFHETP
jgi:tetratricopeptide (TPR) repeat protein